MVTGKIREIERGKLAALHGRPIWEPYFERSLAECTLAHVLPPLRAK